MAKTKKEQTIWLSPIWHVVMDVDGRVMAGMRGSQFLDMTLDELIDDTTAVLRRRKAANGTEVLVLKFKATDRYMVTHVGGQIVLVPTSFGPNDEEEDGGGGR